MEICKIIDLGEDKKFAIWSLNANLQSTDLGKDNQKKILKYKKFAFHALEFEENEFIIMLIMV
jgi:hypothetical protein